MKVSLDKIWIFPIKSFDGVSVDRATVLSSGALQGDREFALVDENGKFVNGKRTPLIHGLRAKFDLKDRLVTISLARESSSQTFALDREKSRLERWLSDYFNLPIRLVQNSVVGFPDDTNSPGPTIISNATLRTVASWFSDLDITEIRQRFRTNLELNTDEAFWEDRLFATVDRVQQFLIGTVEFQGINPCQRCIVPTRDSLDGEAYPNFQKTFVTQRQATLPASVETSRFNHFYRLAVNTRIVNQSGGIIQVGDLLNYRAMHYS
jgi:uncharacterized protein